MRLACAAAGWDAARCRLDPDVQKISFDDFDGLTRDAFYRIAHGRAERLPAASG